VCSANKLSGFPSSHRTIFFDGYVLVIISSIVLKVGMWWALCAAGNLKLEKIKMWGGMVVVPFRRRRLVQLLRGTRFSSNQKFWNLRYDVTFLSRKCWICGARVGYLYITWWLGVEYYSCRVELLNIVRKHPSSIEQLSNEDAEVDPQFWCELLDLFFVRGIADREEEKADDDLVFFVRLQVSSHTLTYPKKSQKKVS